MKTKNTKSKMLSVRYLLFLPFLFFTFCQEGSEEFTENPEEVITVESNIVTLMKAAVATKSDDDDDDDDDDNDEQCIEYKYPIAFYAYYANSRSIETRVIYSDEQLFDFFDELEAADQLMIDFPIELIGTDEPPTTTTIESIEDLEATLAIAVEACRGNDDYDYCDDKNKKVYICHNGHTICVSVNAIKAHLDHGDVLGKCDDDDDDDDYDDDDDEDDDDDNDDD